MLPCALELTCSNAHGHRTGTKIKIAQVTLEPSVGEYNCIRKLEKPTEGGADFGVKTAPGIIFLAYRYQLAGQAMRSSVQDKKVISMHISSRAHGYKVQLDYFKLEGSNFGQTFVQVHNFCNIVNNPDLQVPSIHTRLLF